MTDSTRYALKPTLRVGQVWKSGEGKKVTITQKIDDDDDLFPFDGSDGRSYTSSGSCFDNTRSKSDLVELLSDAPTDEWQAVYHAAAQLDPIACCLSELRDRVVALEAAGGVAGNPGYAFAAPAPATADGLSPVEPAPQARQGVTVDELVDCLPNPFKGDLESFAQLLLDHPRIGPLLRGEGAADPKRVALPEEPPAPVSNPKWFFAGHFRYVQGRRDGWKAAYAEVERQQGGQADD